MSEPRHCPNCHHRLHYDDSRDEDGNVENAWYHCDNCDYYESARED